MDKKLNKIIKFSAIWCQPCKVFAKTFHDVKEMEKYKNINFEEIDIENDDAEILVEKYQIKSVPTTVLIDENEEPIYKIIGNVPKQDFINIINQSLETTN